MSESVYERVKKRAYEIWEEEGRPWGRDAIHWEQAHREIAAASLAPAETSTPAAPDPEVKAAKTPSRRTGKKAAG